MTDVPSQPGTLVNRSFQPVGTPVTLKVGLGAPGGSGSVCNDVTDSGLIEAARLTSEPNVGTHVLVSCGRSCQSSALPEGSLQRHTRRLVSFEKSCLLDVSETGSFLSFLKGQARMNVSNDQCMRAACQLRY